jgi:hypothetical protein
MTPEESPFKILNPLKNSIVTFPYLEEFND